MAEKQKMGDRPLPEGIYGRSPLRELYDKGAANMAGRVYRDTVTDAADWMEYLANEGKAVGRGIKNVVGTPIESFRQGAGMRGRGAPAAPEAQAELMPTAVPVRTQAVAPQAAPMSPERARAAQTLNSLLEANLASDQNTYNPRQAIERLDTRDLDAMRERMQANAERTGRPIPAGSLAVIDKIENARRAEARQGISTNDTYRLGSRNAARAERATDALTGQQYNTIANRNVTDQEKMEFENATAVLADPMMRDTPAFTDATAYMARRAQPGVQSRIQELLSRDTETFAEGGEVGMDAEYVGEMPQAIAPVDMDSGDYVIPVEAMRFYGRKFFTDLINKAEDTE